MKWESIQHVWYTPTHIRFLSIKKEQRLLCLLSFNCFHFKLNWDLMNSASLTLYLLGSDRASRCFHRKGLHESPGLPRSGLLFRKSAVVLFSNCPFSTTFKATLTWIYECLIVFFYSQAALSRPVYHYVSFDLRQCCWRKRAGIFYRKCRPWYRSHRVLCQCIWRSVWLYP